MKLLNRESDFLKLLAMMEGRGILVDQDLCRKQARIGRQAIELATIRLGGRKADSNKDMQALFTELGIPFLADHKSKTTGAPSFDKAAMKDYDPILRGLPDPRAQSVVENIMSFRGWKKACTTYYEPYLEKVHSDGRIRPNLNTIGTVTGRLSCSNPNLQQIPKETDDTKPWNTYTKKVFVPRPGYRLLSVDYSQLELRLAAWYANQQNLIEVFNRGRGFTQDQIAANKDHFDVFNAMATTLGRDRNACKTLTYAKMYLASALKIGLMLGERFSQEVSDAFFYYGKDYVMNQRKRDAQRIVYGSSAGVFYKEWEKTYSNIVALSRRVNDKAADQGVISYWTGRQRHLPWMDRRKGFNSLVQGGGAEIVKDAMIRLFRHVDNPDCQIILQVHDSVLFEVKESRTDEFELLTKEVMEDVASDFPLFEGVYFATTFEYWN